MSTSTKVCLKRAIHLGQTKPDPATLPWIAVDSSLFKQDLTTCPSCCPTVLYKWGRIDGLWCICRTNPATKTSEVTPPVKDITQALSWWIALLNGTAR